MLCSHQLMYSVSYFTHLLACQGWNETVLPLLSSLSCSLSSCEIIQETKKRERGRWRWDDETESSGCVSVVLSHVRLHSQVVKHSSRSAGVFSHVVRMFAWVTQPTPEHNKEQNMSHRGKSSPAGPVKTWRCWINVTQTKHNRISDRLHNDLEEHKHIKQR